MFKKTEPIKITELFSNKTTEETASNANTQPNNETTAEPEAPNFTEQAFSILKNEDGWNVIQINYDKNLMTTDVPKVVNTYIDRAEAIERFKILVVASGLLG